VPDKTANQTNQEIYRLHKKQHPITKYEKKTLIKFSDQKLDDAVYSLLETGLKIAVTPRYTSIEDILTGVEKAILSLPVEKADEARQETVRILKKTLMSQRQTKENREGSTEDLKG